MGLGRGEGRGDGHGQEYADLEVGGDNVSTTRDGTGR